MQICENGKWVKYGSAVGKDAMTAEGLALLFTKTAFVLNEKYGPFSADLTQPDLEISDGIEDAEVTNEEA